VALIISTIVVYQQIQYAKDRPMGYDINRLMISDINEGLSRNYTSLKNELLQSGVVTSVTKASSPVTDIWSVQRVDDWEGKMPNESLGLATVAVSDSDYFKTLGMQIAGGRNFSDNTGKDSLSVILNEAAVKRMRYKMPLNQVITWHDNPQRVTVIGVVKDALMASPFSPAEPTIFIFLPKWENSIMYRLSPTVNPHDAVDRLAGIFQKYSPFYPYQYKFADETYAAKFNLEVLIGKLAGLFATLTVFISCLGLFGLATYTAEQRMKEISIRKVLGASVPQLWLLLSKGFLVLVFISCVIASPVALYFLRQWLEKYNYRISIGPVVFIASTLLAVVLTLFTISFQAIRAAMTSPVKSLRNE
jgi:ABC-type antimicrobial peptide transport system permease subunit